jgi:hypothetical protein
VGADPCCFWGRARAVCNFKHDCAGYDLKVNHLTHSALCMLAFDKQQGAPSDEPEPDQFAEGATADGFDSEAEPSGGAEERGWLDADVLAGAMLEELDGAAADGADASDADGVSELDEGMLGLELRLAEAEAEAEAELEADADAVEAHEGADDDDDEYADECVDDE